MNSLQRTSKGISRMEASKPTDLQGGGINAVSVIVHPYVNQMHGNLENRSTIMYEGSRPLPKGREDVSAEQRAKF